MKHITLTSLNCKNLLFFSSLSNDSKYFCLYKRTVSTWVLCFTAKSRALYSYMCKYTTPKFLYILYAIRYLSPRQYNKPCPIMHTHIQIDSSKN